MQFRRPEKCPLCHPLSWVVILGAVCVGIFMWLESGAGARSFVGDFVPQIKQMREGAYRGEYQLLGLMTAATVSFHVDSGRALDVRLERLAHSPGHESAKAIRTAVQASDDLLFDGVSGATLSSDFARAAIRVAVENGPNSSVK